MNSMDHRIASARPSGRALTAAVVLASLRRLSRRQPSSRSPQPSREEAPAKPARSQPAPAQAGRSQQPAPQGSRLRPREQPQLMYSPWMKVCGKASEPNAKQVCVITKDGRAGKRHAGRGRAAVRAGRRAQEVLRITVPLGMQLQHGTRLIIDQGQPATAPYYDLLPGRLHGRLRGDRRHDRADEEGPDADRAGDQHAGHGDQPAAAARRFRQGL